MANRTFNRIAAMAVLSLLVPVLLAACAGGDSDTDAGLSRADVAEIVRAELANVPEPEPGLTSGEVEQIVQVAIAGIPEPESGLTRAEVEQIAGNVAASIPPRTNPSAYTKFFVDRAIIKYETEGLEATLELYNSAESVDEQWYLFIVAEGGEVLAHYDPDIVGMDLNGPIGTDIAGYNFGAEMLEATSDGRWVSYVFNNPDSGDLGLNRTGNLESKHSWVVKHDGLLFGSGWYTDAGLYTKFFVNSAISKYNAEGFDATLERYNSAESLDGQWYLFLSDEVGNIIAHYDPGLMGSDVNDLLGTDMYEATEEGEWVSHTDINPVTGELQGKHFWVVEYDGLVFGSGWHHDETG